MRATITFDIDQYGNATPLQADEATPADGVPREITGAGALLPTDVNCAIRYNSVSGANLEVGTDAAMQLRSGKTTLTVWMQNTGAPAFTAAAGVTIRGTPPAIAQYGWLCLVHTGVENTWAYA